MFVWRGSGRILVNRKPLDAYFSDLLMRSAALRPLAVTGLMGQVDVLVQVRTSTQRAVAIARIAACLVGSILCLLVQGDRSPCSCCPAKATVCEQYTWSSCITVKGSICKLRL